MFIYQRKRKKDRDVRQLAAEVNSYRKWNAVAACLAMVMIFIVYIASSGRAPESDNIGVIVVPLILLTIWGPAVSVACGLLETARIRQSSNASDKGYFSVFMSTQSRFFKVSGAIGLVLLIFGMLKLGLKEFLEIPLFPFWALEYLF
jgi:hypothetical protein